MSGNDAARAFLESLAGYTNDPQGDAPSHDRPVKLATVSPAYSGTGEAAVKFDGENLMGVRTYVALLPVKAGDRVAMLPVGRTYVILGSVAGLSLAASAIKSGTLPLARGGTGVSAASLAELKVALGIPYAETGGITPSSGAAGGVVAPVYFDGLTTIVLPVGMFTVKPNVSVDVEHSGQVQWASLSTASTTSFTVRIMRLGAAPTASQPLHWTARQGTATGVAG